MLTGFIGLSLSVFRKDTQQRSAVHFNILLKPRDAHREKYSFSGELKPPRPGLEDLDAVVLAIAGHDAAVADAERLDAFQLAGAATPRAERADELALRVEHLQRRLGSSLLAGCPHPFGASLSHCHTEKHR